MAASPSPERRADRLAGIPTTIFATMSALAVRTGSVNLGQGFPDSDGPRAVLDAAARALFEGHNQYPPGPGIPALRAAVAEHQRRHYGLELDPDTQVLITTGCTEAIAGAILGLINPGDEVIVLEPYYDSYVAMLQMTGGVRRPVTLRPPEFRLDLDEVRAALTPRTRFLLINTPHNPTGSVLNPTELAALAEIAVAHDLIAITDEVYEHLTYDGHRHLPLATLPGMAERTLTLSSIGKSYSVTGWKIGWACGPADLVGSVMAAKQWLSYVSGGPLQPAAAYALEHQPHWPRELARELAGRRDLLAEGLADLGLNPAPVQGGYFLLTDVGPLGWPDGMEFCLALPERAGVVAIPAQVFYDDAEAGRTLVRWTFCKSTDTIAEALHRLRRSELTHS